MARVHHGEDTRALLSLWRMLQNKSAGQGLPAIVIWGYGDVYVRI